MGPIRSPETSVSQTNLRRVTYQKSKDLIYTTAEVWNLKSVKSYFISCLK